METVVEQFAEPGPVHGHNGITTANNGQFQHRSIVISAVVVVLSHFDFYVFITAFCVLSSICEERAMMRRCRIQVRMLREI